MPPSVLRAASSPAYSGQAGVVVVNPDGSSIGGGSSSSSSTASLGGGATTYSNLAGDFTATANNGAKTITLSAFKSTVLSSVISSTTIAAAIIKRRNSSGVVDTLPVTTVGYSGSDITLADMTGTFAAGDTVAVFLIGPDKALDRVNDQQKVTEATLLAGEDLNANRLLTEVRNSYAAISTATTTVIKTGSGLLHSITVTGGTTGTIIVYDNTAGSGTIIASFDTTNALANYNFNDAFSTGLTIVTSAATKITVNYR